MTFEKYIGGWGGIVQQATPNQVWLASLGANYMKVAREPNI